jgi:DNA-binding GntR family transcriptional regulator
MKMLAPQPRYRQLAQTLIKKSRVANIGGRSSVDEFKLCEQFGASRFTVREASECPPLKTARHRVIS